MFLHWHVGLWFGGDYRSSCWFLSMSLRDKCFILWYLFPFWIFRDCSLYDAYFLSLLCGGVRGEYLLVLLVGSRGDLEKMVCCRSWGNPEDWVWRNRESEEGSLAAYLVFCQEWPMIGYIYLIWGLGHSNRGDWRPMRNGLWDLPEEKASGAGGSWYSAVLPETTLRIGFRRTKKHRHFKDEG